MKISFGILTIVVILAACGRTQHQVSEYQAQEDSLFSQILDSIIQPDSIYSQQPGDTLTDTAGTLPLSGSRGINKSDLAPGDTSPLFIVINRELIRYAYIFNISYVRDNPAFYFKYVIRSSDTALLELFKKFLFNKSLKARRLNANALRTQYNYNLAIANEKERKRINRSQISETHKWSRITFNDDFSKACFYDQVSYGSGLPLDYLVLLEKKAGYWHIIAKRRF